MLHHVTHAFCLMEILAKNRRIPIPEYPFAEVSMDLCDNLNAVGGYSHLLIIQGVLTEYIIIYPLKSETAQEFSKNIFFFTVYCRILILPEYTQTMVLSFEIVNG